jgi:hypothetical protein
MKNPFESIKRAIKKMWSEAPSLATTELLKLFHTNPRLDGARVIASKCASTELYLYDRADFRKNKNKAEIIETHELYDLLDDPCPNIRELTGWHIKFFVFACYVLVGEAFLLKVRKPNGKIIALQPISPSWVVKTPTETGSYWEIYPYGTAGGNAIVVPREDVIYFKDINLLDPLAEVKDFQNPSEMRFSLTSMLQNMQRIFSLMTLHRQPSFTLQTETRNQQTKLNRLGYRRWQDSTTLKSRWF